MESKVKSSKALLMTTTFLEGPTGLALMTVPSFVVKLLLGSPLTEPISLIIIRVGGLCVGKKNDSKQVYFKMKPTLT